MQTNKNIQTTTSHILQLKTCNEKSSLSEESKKQKKLALWVCPFPSLRWMCFKMSKATSTDLHKEIKFSLLHNLPSANWTYLAGKPWRKRKFWPERHHLWNRPSFPHPQAIRWMSNMRWISSPNSYQNIKICSKHSWKMDHSIHIHFGRRSNIKTQTNQIWAAFRFSMIFSKRRKEMITMF